MSRGVLRVPLDSLAAGVTELPVEAMTYVLRVHRLREGDRFVAFDPEQAMEADATLVEIGRRSAAVRVDAPRPASLRPVRRVTWIQGVGKGDKMDAIVRDATELGATRIIPVIAERSVARPSEDKGRRWRRVAIEAARQCGRGDAPHIEPPMALEKAIALLDQRAIRLCLDPAADGPLGARLWGLPPAAELGFVVGPEGGLTTDEIAGCEAAGLARVRLGALTLRTETVCAAVLGALIAASEGAPEKPAYASPPASP